MTNAIANDLKEKMALLPGTRDVQLSRDDLRPEYNVVFDRDRLSYYGMNGATASQAVKNRIDGLVAEVTPTHVKMDFNHPLVDKTVRFDGEIKVVRDATPEELTPAQGGCGCGGDGCGCDDHCGCDDQADGGCGCHCGH